MLNVHPINIRRMIETPIMSKDFIGSIRPQLQEKGLDLALAEDAVRAVMRIVTDREMNGEFS